MKLGNIQLKEKTTKILKKAKDKAKSVLSTPPQKSKTYYDLNTDTVKSFSVLQEKDYSRVSNLVYKVKRKNIDAITKATKSRVKHKVNSPEAVERLKQQKLQKLEIARNNPKAKQKVGEKVKSVAGKVYNTNIANLPGKAIGTAIKNPGTAVGIGAGEAVYGVIGSVGGPGAYAAARALPIGPGKLTIAAGTAANQRIRNIVITRNGKKTTVGRVLGQTSGKVKRKLSTDKDISIHGGVEAVKKGAKRVSTVFRPVKREVAII